MFAKFYPYDFAGSDRPMAAGGLTSYRARGRYSWIMIGAKNIVDAHSEAQRSQPGISITLIEVWNGREYVPATRTRTRTLTT